VPFKVRVQVQATHATTKQRSPRAMHRSKLGKSGNLELGNLNFEKFRERCSRFKRFLPPKQVRILICCILLELFALAEDGMKAKELSKTSVPSREDERRRLFYTTEHYGNGTQIIPRNCQHSHTESLILVIR